MAIAAPPLAQLQANRAGIANAGQAALQQGMANANSPVVGNQAYGGLVMGPNGAYVSSVDPKTGTVAGQLATDMASSSPLEQLAQSQGMNAAAARGSANGTLFAGAEQAELNQDLTPIAAQDADAFNKSALANAANVDQAGNVNTQANAETTSAGIGANASMYNADVNAKTQAAALAQNAQQFSANWDNQFKMATQSQAFQQASQATQNEFQAKYNAFNTTMQTVMSDPSYWSDPTAATGMVNYFNNAFDDIMGTLGITGPAAPNPSVPSTATGP